MITRYTMLNWENNLKSIEMYIQKIRGIKISMVSKPFFNRFSRFVQIVWKLTALREIFKYQLIFRKLNTCRCVSEE